MTGIPDVLIVPPEVSDHSGHVGNGASAASASFMDNQVRDDPLGDVLSTVRLSGALFFVVESTSPWCIEVPHTCHYASTVLPRAQHLFSYHIAVEGDGFASVPGVEPVPYESGDILVFPHGDAYRMQNALETPPELSFDETMQFMQALANGSLPFVVKEGGGSPPTTTTICGFLGCDAHPFNPVLASLPRLLCLRRPRGKGGDILDKLIELTMDEATTGRPGGSGVGLRLSELLFIELIRRYVDAPGPKPPGTLAALRDAPLARALGAIHAHPEDNWTVGELACRAGISRSALAQRFVEMIGHPPLRYLTLWRMQVAAKLLQENVLPISEIGRRVGYAAEPAFSRRFKSVTGVSPTDWRTGARQGHEKQRGTDDHRHTQATG